MSDDFVNIKSKQLKKLKASKKKIADEFKNIMDVTPFLDDNFNNRQEDALKQMFIALNQK